MSRRELRSLGQAPFIGPQGVTGPITRRRAMADPLFRAPEARVEPLGDVLFSDAPLALQRAEEEEGDALFGGPELPAEAMRITRPQTGLPEFVTYGGFGPFQTPREEITIPRGVELPLLTRPAPRTLPEFAPRGDTVLPGTIVVELQSYEVGQLIRRVNAPLDAGVELVSLTRLKRRGWGAFVRRVRFQAQPGVLMSAPPMDAERCVTISLALQRYLRAVERFEAASKDFNESCQTIRQALPVSRFMR